MQRQFSSWNARYSLPTTRYCHEMNIRASAVSCRAAAISSQGLNQPISLSIIQNTAYVVTLGGEVWTIDDIAGPPFGR